MSKITIRLLAVSAIALGAAFAGHNQASAFSLGSSFLLSQASGGGGVGGGAGGAPGAAGSGGALQNEPGKGSSGASPGGTPGAGTTQSPSAGVPARCAAITDVKLRADCITRERSNMNKSDKK